MKLQGFNPAALVARGVFDSLEEADRVLCALDDARPGARIIAVSWQEGFGFMVQVQGSKFSMQGGRGLGESHNLAGAGATPAPAPTLSAGSGSFLQSASPSRTSLAPAPADSDCPWCAIERAKQGHGSAPMAPFVPRTRCARHAPVEAAKPSTNAPHPAVARDASPLAPAAALLFPGSAGAEPFHPKLNPHAGVRPAYPKGRWS